MDPSMQPLVDRLDSLCGDSRELREGVRQAIEVANLDPEMALTRARKVLEYVIKDVYERRIKEPTGTRPLENLIQRLVKDKILPYRLEAYASIVRNLGNVGTHRFGEKITAADVTQSLNQLTFILEWYFESELPDPGGARAASRRKHLAGQKKQGVAPKPSARSEAIREKSTNRAATAPERSQPAAKLRAGKRLLVIGGIGAVALIGLGILCAGWALWPREKESGQPPFRGSAGENPAAKAPDKPMANVDDIEYVVDKVTRNGAAVTLEILATNSKDDCTITFTGVEAVDTDGNFYGGRHVLIGPGAGGKVDVDPRPFVQPRNVKLGKGVKTRFEVTMPKVPGKVSEFQVVELLPLPPGVFDPQGGRSPIKFSNVRIGK